MVMMNRKQAEAVRAKIEEAKKALNDALSDAYFQGMVVFLDMKREHVLSARDFPLIQVKVDAAPWAGDKDNTTEEKTPGTRSGSPGSGRLSFAGV